MLLPFTLCNGGVGINCSYLQGANLVEIQYIILSYLGRPVDATQDERTPAGALDLALTQLIQRLLLLLFFKPPSEKNRTG